MKKRLVAIVLSLPVAIIILSWHITKVSNYEIRLAKCAIKHQTSILPTLEGWSYTYKAPTKLDEKPIGFGIIPDYLFEPSTITLTPGWVARYFVPLQPVAKVTDMSCWLSPRLGWDSRIWGNSGDKQALLKAIDRSLQYLQTSEAAKAYQFYPIPGITRERVFRSLKRFRELVLKSSSPEQLLTIVNHEFVFYQSVGKNNTGKVLFTGYYEPIYVASRVPTPEFRYPIYKLPPDFNKWSKPHPTREQLEGKDGLQGSKGRLHGLELYWLRDRLEPYLMQIEGSARLQLTDGTQATVNYADSTAYPYTSLGRELVRDHQLPLQGLTMPKIIQYFHQHPTELNNYIPRDRSFVFFQDTKGSPAMGSINVPLTPERSIATDKSLMPPGALALIDAAIPLINNKGVMEYGIVSRYVLDQDTGGAIKGAGRVDYFLGSGKNAGDRAGIMVGNGQLFYLLLKE